MMIAFFDFLIWFLDTNQVGIQSIMTSVATSITVRTTYRSICPVLAFMKERGARWFLGSECDVFPEHLQIMTVISEHLVMIPPSRGEVLSLENLRSRCKMH